MLVINLLIYIILKLRLNCLKWIILIYLVIVIKLIKIVHK